MRVSVTIPTFGRPDTLCDVVRDVWAGDRRPDEIVVVCQDEDAVETARRLKQEVPDAFSRLRFYASKRRGTNANRNDAVRLATGDFIAFTDDDMRLPPDWLASMMEAWEHGWAREDVLLTGPIHASADVSDMATAPGRRVSPDRRVWRSPPLIGDVLFGEQFGAPKTAFERAGSPPFDERFGPGSSFPGAGDEEFAVRVLKAGVPIVFEPSIQATHLAHSRHWVRSQWTHAQGVGAMYVLRWSSGERRALAVAMRNLLGILAKSGRNVVTLRWHEAVGRLAGAAGIFQGALRWRFSGAIRGPRTREPASEELTLLTLE